MMGTWFHAGFAYRGVTFCQKDRSLWILNPSASGLDVAGIASLGLY